MKVEELNGFRVTILDYQATNMLIEAFELQIKINFRGKEEFRLTKQTTGTFQLSDKNPLLFDYNEHSKELFINSKPSYPDLFISEIKSAIEKITERKRNWIKYVTKNSMFSFENFQQNIIQGHGFLLEAPTSIANEVEIVCRNLGVQSIAFTSAAAFVPKKIITIGSNYVVATDFIA